MRRRVLEVQEVGFDKAFVYYFFLQKSGTNTVFLKFYAKIYNCDGVAINANTYLTIFFTISVKI